jgi:acetone carboxylase, gamma subunit
MTEHPRELIRDVVAGSIGSDDLQAVQRAPKDPARRQTVIELEQERVAFDDPILVCLQEALYVVARPDGERVVKCRCGQDFGDYRRNWKESAAVVEREGEVPYFPGPRAADPDWMVLREFYCPSCATRLDVECVPPGYPFIEHFVPAI